MDGLAPDRTGIRTAKADSRPRIVGVTRFLADLGVFKTALIFTAMTVTATVGLCYGLFFVAAPEMLSNPVTIVLPVLVPLLLTPVMVRRIVILLKRLRIAEKAASEALDKAEEASKAKSSFLAGMSHELRTPLNAIIGFSEFTKEQMAGPIGNPKYLEYADDIHRSGLLLLDLINDILDLSKVEAGGYEMRIEEIDLHAVVERSVTMVALMAEKREVRIHTEVPVPCLIAADERAVTQILLNLLSNAVKFSHQGGNVTLSVLQVDGVSIVVSDDGIGIRPEDIPKALEPFRQIAGAESVSNPGTGIGLPLSKGLVELHRGTLSIESEPGEGTSVIANFPPASSFQC